MNLTLLLAAGLMSLTVLVHVIIGGRIVMRPLRQAPCPV